jgi:hypothetical protein
MPSCERAIDEPTASCADADTTDKANAASVQKATAAVAAGRFEIRFRVVRCMRLP